MRTGMKPGTIDRHHEFPCEAWHRYDAVRLCQSLKNRVRQMRRHLPPATRIAYPNRELFFWMISSMTFCISSKILSAQSCLDWWTWAGAGADSANDGSGITSEYVKISRNSRTWTLQFFVIDQNHTCSSKTANFGILTSLAKQNAFTRVWRVT